MATAGPASSSLPLVRAWRGLGEPPIGYALCSTAWRQLAGTLPAPWCYQRCRWCSTIKDCLTAQYRQLPSCIGDSLLVPNCRVVWVQCASSEAGAAGRPDLEDSVGAQQVGKQNSNSLCKSHAWQCQRGASFPNCCRCTRSNRPLPTHPIPPPKDAPGQARMSELEAMAAPDTKGTTRSRTNGSRSTQ